MCVWGGGGGGEGELRLGGEFQGPSLYETLAYTQQTMPLILGGAGVTTCPTYVCIYRAGGRVNKMLITCWTHNSWMWISISDQPRQHIPTAMVYCR